MNKTSTCVFYGPFDTYSGYAARSRDIAKALIETKGEEWDIKLMPCRWGNTPHGFIDDNPEWLFLKDHFLDTPQLTYKPDYWFMCTIPSEFQAYGSVSVVAGDTVIPFDELTEDTVIEWVEAKLDLTKLEANLDAQIREQKTPKVTSGLPWSLVI